MGACMHLTKAMKQQLTQLPGAAMLLLSICVGTPAHAQTSGDSPSTSWANSPYMLGDWGANGLPSSESFDPAGTPAAEVRYVPSKHVYVKSAIFSGNRNPYHDDISGVNFKFKDNPVIATEAGYAAAPVAGPLIGAGLAGWFVRLAHI